MLPGDERSVHRKPDTTTPRKEGKTPPGDPNNKHVKPSAKLGPEKYPVGGILSQPSPSGLASSWRPRAGPSRVFFSRQDHGSVCHHQSPARGVPRKRYAGCSFSTKQSLYTTTMRKKHLKPQNQKQKERWDHEEGSTGWFLVDIGLSSRLFPGVGQKSTFSGIRVSSVPLGEGGHRSGPAEPRTPSESPRLWRHTAMRAVRTLPPCVSTRGHPGRRHWHERTEISTPASGVRVKHKFRVVWVLDHVASLTSV